MAFKDRLKDARLKNGLTQEQLAEKIGVAKSTFTGYEKGNREPNISTISKIVKVLNIDANYLWQDQTAFPFELSYDEMENLVKKYRDLDPHGKKMVDFTLKEEWERSKETVKTKEASIYTLHPDEIPSRVATESHSYEVKAARNNYMEDDDEVEKLLKDLSKLKRPD